MDKETEQTSPVWKWPFEWATSKAFWENVASNVMANLIVAAGGLVLVLLSGFLPSKEAYIRTVQITGYVLAPSLLFLAQTLPVMYVAYIDRRGDLGEAQEATPVIKRAIVVGLICVLLGITGALWQTVGAEAIGTFLWDHRMREG